MTNMTETKMGMLVNRLRSARMALLAVAAALLPGCGTGAADDPLSADAGWVRIPTQDTTTESVRARFERPKGKGPFAAVVVIHPGGGVRGTPLDYGRWLREWGYVALVIDSYGSRNIRSTGDVGTRQGTRYQLADLYGALSWLARRPDIDKQRIAAIGFSRGGQTTLSAIAAEETLPGYLHDGLRRPGRVALGIGVFASCIDVDELRFEGKLLMLVGDRDRERNVECARELVAKARAAGFAAEAKVYPGARHDYTSRRGTDDDRTAAEDSLIRTREFLDRELK
jgi:dienelactone hydrolase